MSTIGNQLPNIPGSGVGVPPRIQTAPPVAPPSLPPSEQFTPSGGQAPANALPNQPQVTTQANLVKVARFSSQGVDTGLKAVLPAVPGGGQFLPMNVSLEIHKDANGQAGAKAYLSDEFGNALVDSQGKARELPAYQLDGRYLVPTDPKNPGASPYILVELEAAGGVAYGMAQGIEYKGDPAQGYKINRSELLDSDNNKVMRFAEEAGPLKEKESLMKKFSSLVGSKGAPDLGRSLQYEQVLVTPQGTSKASVVQFDHLKPSERPYGSYMKHAKYVVTDGLTPRFEGTRPLANAGNGNLTLGPAEMSLMTGGIGRKFPQNTVTVRPLSADFASPAAQAQLAHTLTGGEAMAGAPPSPPGGAAPTPDAPTTAAPTPSPTPSAAYSAQEKLEKGIQDKFEQQFNPQVKSLFLAPDSPHLEAHKAAQTAAREAVTSGKDPEVAYVTSLTNYASEQMKQIQAAAQGGNPVVLMALQAPKQAFGQIISSGQELLGMLAQRPNSEASAAPTANAAQAQPGVIASPADAQHMIQLAQQTLGEANQSVVQSTAQSGVAVQLRQAKEEMMKNGMTAAQARQNIGAAIKQNGGQLQQTSTKEAQRLLSDALKGFVDGVKKEAGQKGLKLTDDEAGLIGQMRMHSANLTATAANSKLPDMVPEANIPTIGSLLQKNLDESGQLKAGAFAQELSAILGVQQPAVSGRVQELYAQAGKATNPDEREKLFNQAEDIEAHLQGYHDAYNSAVVLDSAKTILVGKELLDSQGLSADPKSLAQLSTGKFS